MSTAFDEGDLCDDPGTTTALDLSELDGRLLIKPIRVERDVSTTLGPKDATVAGVVVLDGAAAWSTFTDCLIWPKVLQAQLKSTVGTGRYCLGRLGTGVAKPGQSAPWKLADPTDADRELARAYLADQAPF